MDQVKSAILATLTYSDVFDYPLTRAELWRYLIAAKPIPFTRFQKALTSLESVGELDRLYYLKGRRKLVEERQKRKKISEKKIQQAQQTVRKLSYIPTIEFIGLSGSLAMANATKDADVDVFVITKPGTLWITRLCIAILLQCMQKRRKRRQKHAPNRICVNMLIDSAHLLFPKERRDSYTAHEIVQMKPLFVRGYMYHELLRKNNWITSFLPNGFPASVLRELPPLPTTTQHPLTVLEPVARVLQLWYMAKHRTTETIRNGFVAFHPFDYKKEVLLAWERKKEKYGVSV